ncbi:hypothetical protein JTE90_017390 [Oedothorax gibbosus]|uniref:Integrase catalytic domain-containing protein n=1 Tax=Oedothorax gibbosus TaxID=931172 RepID=A0AAV6VPB6_9ARAC|nr:hypothetical protein JTE90_017390 [Oedothorax gibbosus]
MFLMALRRFVARRGRCTTIYCDNGTNFVGAANCLRLLDWNKVIKHGAINNIHWKFNPPTAAWWGGWWKRLIRVMKDLLKRVLGRALLSQEEMFTVLCDCESLMNSRPLTYISENNKDPVPLSPSMFLQDIQEWKTPDLDSVDQKSLNRRHVRRSSMKIRCAKTVYAATRTPAAQVQSAGNATRITIRSYTKSPKFKTRPVPRASIKQKLRRIYHAILQPA